jgi:hypothetical protein
MFQLLLRLGRFFVALLGRSTSSCFTMTTYLRNFPLRLAFVFMLLIQFGFWKQYVGFFNELVGEEPLDLCMRVPPHATNFDALHVSATGNQRKAAIQAARQDGTIARDLENWLEFQPQRFQAPRSQVPRTCTKLVEALEKMASA